MNKYLPLGNPVYSLRPYENASMSILDGSGENYWIWLLTDYIQLYGWKHPGEMPSVVFYFYEDPLLNCPWLTTSREDFQDSSLSNVKIIDMLIEKLNSDHYILAYLNSKYIKAYASYYRKEDRHHNILIYGYDEDAATFTCKDFFGSHYSTQQVSFNEISQAFYNSEKKNILFIKKITANMTKDINIFNSSEKMISRLDDYLNSRNPLINPLNQNQDKAIFGLETYRYLFEILLELAERKSTVNLSLFHYIYAHKQLLNHRIHLLNKYYNNDGSI